MIIFHRFLIGTAIAFFLLFAVWSISVYSSAGDTLLLVLGIVSIVVAAALAYYLKNLKRFLGR